MIQDPRPHITAVDLKGKIIVITGASQGIGKAIALACACEHARVVITYLMHQEDAIQVASQCKKLGAPEVLYVPLDVRDKESRKSCCELLKKQFGKIDILINNAGIASWKRIAEAREEEIADEIQTNLAGPILFTKLLLPEITHGIVAIGSGAGYSGYEELATYCATKWGIRGFMKSLALEYPGLHIFTVNPGSTATAMTDFKGISPDRVAEIVINSLREEIAVPPGGDVNMWDFGVPKES